MKRVALNYLRNEHRRLAQVLAALEMAVTDLQARKGVPDFELLASMLYYIDAFPEREHHPKEDDFLYAAMRRCPGCDLRLLDELAAEHARSPPLMRALERALVHWIGGAPDGLASFAQTSREFIDFERAHMKKEEERALPAAEALLPESDWTTLAAEFAKNDDPLFGARRHGQFDRLYEIIKIRSPRKRRKLFHTGAVT